MRSTVFLAVLALRCANGSVVCESTDAPSTCVPATEPAEHYAAQAGFYFDTLDRSSPDAEPRYATTVVRWEWPPWLKLSGYGRDEMIAMDSLTTWLYPGVVVERDCRTFEHNPFARCHVVFIYDAFPGRRCPIYEEFTFNRAGEITFVEAWSAFDGFPARDDYEEERLSSRIPGLGSESGRIATEGSAWKRQRQRDADLADLDARLADWRDAALAEYRTAGGHMWELGCR